MGNFHPLKNLKCTFHGNEAVQITTFSIIDLIKYLLSNSVSYVLTKRFCQDPLENYFGQQRAMGS